MYSTTVNYENRSLAIYNALTPVSIGSTWDAILKALDYTETTQRTKRLQYTRTAR